ncbi:MAG TPA: hypothetical protein VF320_11575, partial [Acidimicrobiales bacterium]
MISTPRSTPGDSLAPASPDRPGHPEVSSRRAEPSAGDLPAAGVVALAALLVGMLAAATYRSGGFYPEVGLGVAVLSVPLIVLGLRYGDDRSGLRVSLSVGGLATWWLVRCLTADAPKTFLPFGASLLGFLAAFLVTRALDRPGRLRLTQTLVALGAGSAALGLGAVATRWTALATVRTGSWRVAATLGYANGAGLLFGIALLLALGLDERRRTTGVAVWLCLAGLLATQSLVAIVAVAVAAAFVPRSRWLALHRPLVAGLVVGVAAVSTSTDGPTRAWTLLPILAVVGWASLSPTAAPEGPRRRTGRLAVGVVALAAVVALGLAVRAPGHHLFSAQSDRLGIGWQATNQQWRTSRVTGLGPHGVANLHGPVGDYDNYLGNEYLQVGLDSGLIGLALLAASALAVGLAVRRRDVATSCATAGLVAFAAGGALDYGWHLPALALAGGMSAALASGLVGAPVFTRRPGLAAPAAPAKQATPATTGRRAGRRAPWIVAAAVLALSLGIVGLVTRPTGHDSQAIGTAPSPEAGAPARAERAMAASEVIAQGPDLTDPFVVHEVDRY